MNVHENSFQKIALFYPIKFFVYNTLSQPTAHLMCVWVSDKSCFGLLMNEKYYFCVLKVSLVISQLNFFFTWNRIMMKVLLSKIFCLLLINCKFHKYTLASCGKWWWQQQLLLILKVGSCNGSLIFEFFSKFFKTVRNCKKIKIS